MNHKEIAMSCSVYIEKHIHEELTAEKIAQGIGYSVYYLSRTFKNEMGISLMEYVRERRLVCATKEMAAGQKIIDTAMKYGYETHGGFTKAFKRKFGFTPHLLSALCMTCEMLNENGGELMENQMFISASVDFKGEEQLYKEVIEEMNKKGIYKDAEAVQKAYHMAKRMHEGEKRKSGEDYITHPLNVALILIEMEADEACIIGGLLHEVCEKNTQVTLEEVRHVFGNEIAQMLQKAAQVKAADLAQVEKVGEEVILIKLADRLHNMRTIKYMAPEEFKNKAKETIEIFSPIAAKLGITKLKMELDDLALKYL